MLELLLTINTIIFSSAPTWLKGKRKQGELDQNSAVVAGFFFFFFLLNMQLKEQDIDAEEAEWEGTEVAAAAAAATSWLYPTAVSYGFRVNNLVCLTMTALPLCLCPYPHPHPTSTRLPHAPLPSPDSCSHCSRLLCLPNALLGCMAVRLDHQKVTMQDQSQLWPVSWFQLLTASNKKKATEYGQRHREKWSEGGGGE